MLFADLLSLLLMFFILVSIWKGYEKNDVITMGLLYCVDLVYCPTSNGSQLGLDLFLLFLSACYSQ